MGGQREKNSELSGVQLFRVVSGKWKENCYVVASGATGDGVVIDPGNDADQIWAGVTEHKVKVLGILLTHAHYDHVDGVSAVRERAAAPIYIHRGDAGLLKNANAYAVAWKLPIIKVPAPDVLLNGGEELRFGDLSVSVLHLPGHSAGSVAYGIDTMLFVGDTILPCSVGRVDLPGGDGPALEASIRRVLARVNERTRIFPGHEDPMDLRALAQNNEQVRRCLQEMGFVDPSQAPAERWGLG